MDHHGRVVDAVGAAVLQIEALGQDEIDLNGPELPFAADRVLHVDVELRPVERAAALVELVGDVARFERGADRGLGDLVGRPADVRFARREKILEIGEAERGDQPDRLVGGLLELGLQLLGRAEEVRVVLREAAHAGEAVQRAAPLEAIDGAELREAQRQVAVRAPFAAVDQDVPRAVHRLEPEALPFDFDRPEQAVREVLEMPRGLVELLAARCAA